MVVPLAGRTSIAVALFRFEGVARICGQPGLSPACGGKVGRPAADDCAGTPGNVNFLRRRRSAPEGHASVAQGIEQRPSNPPVGGSIPSWGTNRKHPGSRTGVFLVFITAPLLLLPGTSAARRSCSYRQAPGVPHLKPTMTTTIVTSSGTSDLGRFKT